MQELRDGGQVLVAAQGDDALLEGEALGLVLEAGLDQFEDATADVGRRGLGAEEERAQALGEQFSGT